MIPHLYDTFSDIKVNTNANINFAEVDQLNRHFKLSISDQHIHTDDHFSFVKLSSPLPKELTSQMNYEQLIQFVTLLNQSYRGCNWSLDSLSEDNTICLYSTFVSDLGLSHSDKDQLTMEILNLQKMFFMTEQYILDYNQNPMWLLNLKQKLDKRIIPCFAPENFITIDKSKLYTSLIEYALKLNYKIEIVNQNSFRITNEKQTVSLLTFIGDELVSIYSVISENNNNADRVKPLLNEINQNLILGHLEPSPISKVIGYTNYIRLTNEMSDIKLRLFFDSPEIAKMTYSENINIAA